MTIIAIETSCDETAAALIEGNGNRIILKSNVLTSSLAMHAKTGGIIPENAAREQLKYILPVIQKSLDEAKINLSDINALAITYGPGLIGSLLIGVETVKTLAYVLDKPVIPVNHMVGHIYANFIGEKSKVRSQESKLNARRSPLTATIKFPAIALVVSGGHTDLLLMKDHGNFILLGGTRDDAAGECFDKCARLLGYNYPGGPKIADLAKKGNPHAFPFPRPMLNSQNYEFSFSGLKTSFLNATKQHFPILHTRSADPKIGWLQVVSENQLSAKEKQTLYDLCASLEKAIIDILVKKTINAAKQYHAKSILLSGGVAANQNLREAFKQKANDERLATKIFAPQKFLCTDNAAMIATAAYYNYKPVPLDQITANPQLYFE